jgi:transcriptional regulator with XRE-family HTH domain
MSYATADITSALRTAREAKGLSQRALSKLVDVPQGHISKIESGGVDLRVSSLIELARALDLELTLVPRKSLPAVQSVVRSTSVVDRAPDISATTKLKEFVRLNNRLSELTRAFPASIELAQLRRQIHDLQQLPLSKEDRNKLNDVHAALLQARRKKNLEPIQSALAQLQHIRNEIVHGTLRQPIAERVRPAYSIEDDEHG